MLGALDFESPQPLDDRGTVYNFTYYDVHTTCTYDFSTSQHVYHIIENNPPSAWVFHILPSPDSKSAVWAAQRVPDGEVAVCANAYTIRSMNLTDTGNYLSSPGIVELAEQLGFYDSKTEGPARFRLDRPLSEARPRTRVFSEKTDLPLFR